MPLQLLASDTAALAGLDAGLDAAFLSGATEGVTPVLTGLEGYDKPMVVQEKDQAPTIRPKIRDSFRLVIAALLKTVQGWVAPSLQNSWVNFDGGVTFNPAGYYRDFMGRCHLRGLVAAGSLPGTVFTLPVGYRPLKTHIFAVVSTDAFGQVRVQADGQVRVTGGTNTWVSLDGVSFRAEQ